MSTQITNTLTQEQSDYLRKNMQKSIPRNKLAETLGISISRVYNHIRIFKKENTIKVVSDIELFDDKNYTGIC